MADSTKPMYQYRPLPDHSSVRVLDLVAGKDGEVLSGTISSTSLTDSGVYEALSYAWGEANFSETICIDGVNLPITTSLSAALLQLRKPDANRRLWIDMVCINQEDKEEKATQILLMSEIFANASRVLCWLGPESKDLNGRTTFGLLRAIGRADFTSLPSTQVTTAFMDDQVRFSIRSCPSRISH